MAITEFRTVVESGEILFSQSHQPWKVRLYLCDGSLIDVYYSTQGKYSYHWDNEAVVKRFEFSMADKFKSNWWEIREFTLKGSLVNFDKGDGFIALIVVATM